MQVSKQQYSLVVVTHLYNLLLNVTFVSFLKSVLNNVTIQNLNVETTNSVKLLKINVYKLMFYQIFFKNFRHLNGKAKILSVLFV